MGQKVNPIGLRLGINRTWDSRWYAGKGGYSVLLHEDMKIRAELMKQLKPAAVSKIVIERPHKKARVTIHSARPGVVSGKEGADVEKHRRRRDRADGMVPRGPGAAAHAPRRCRLRHRHRVHDLRHLRRQGVDLQGRDHGARPDGAGQTAGRKRSGPAPARRGVTAASSERN